MTKRPNRYIEKIAGMVGEPDHVRAIEMFVASHRHAGAPLEEVAKNLGVSEIVREEMPFEGGIFELVDGQHRLVVKINSFSPHVRQRFTLAHEIGHLLLHGALGGERNCAGDATLEDACDAIAAEFLMPAREAASFVKQKASCSPETLRTIASAFEVSLHTAALRVHRDLHLWRQLRGIGFWRFKETAEELWFVGARPWKTRRPLLSAFNCALSSRVSIQMQERFIDGYRERLAFLHVLNLGNNHLLGLVA